MLYPGLKPKARLRVEEAWSAQYRREPAGADPNLPLLAALGAGDGELLTGHLFHHPSAKVDHAGNGYVDGAILPTYFKPALPPGCRYLHHKPNPNRPNT